MDVNLENLIEKIRKEAIERGRAEAETIIEKARGEAAAMVKNAEKQAAKIVGDAETRSAKTQENTQHALQQAARDIELALKERIGVLFDRVFKRKVADTLSPEFLEKLILDLVKTWAEKGAVNVVVNPDIQSKLETLLFSHLKDELKKGVTLTAGPGMTKGFRLEMKDGSVYYDFSDETIADVLKEFVNPSLRALLSGNGNESNG